MTVDDSRNRQLIDTISEQVQHQLNETANMLLDAAATIASNVRELDAEQARVQNFVDHFACGSLLHHTGTGTDTASGMAGRINLGAVRRDLDRLRAEVLTETAYHTRLLGAQRELRDMGSAIFSDSQPDGQRAASDIRLNQVVTTTRDAEQERLAREIHDGPAQVMANAIFAIDIAEQVARRDPERVAEELARLRMLLRDGVAEMRRFMFGLNPLMLADQGLVPTLERFIADYRQFLGTEIELEASHVPDTLSGDQQLALFRIIQEALRNVQKHAGAASVMVRLAGDKGHVRVTVTDNGSGFDPDAPRVGFANGAGLPGMRERAALVGAELTVASRPGHGTTVTVDMLIGSPRTLGSHSVGTGGRIA